MNKNQHHTVLITGAVGGIGQGLVEYFAQTGATVIAHDRVLADVQVLAEHLTPHKVFAIAGELTDLPQLQKELARVRPQTGAITSVIANAGSALGLTLESTDFQAWQHDINVNLHASYCTVSAVLDDLKAQRGSIVFISSVNGLSGLGHPAYSAAKAAQMSYSKAVALEYGRFGIRSNVICPGTVKTPAWQARVDKNPEVFQQLKKWYPLQDFATAQDIAEAAEFLLSARIITGTVLPVDGGLMAGNKVMASELTLEEF